MAGLILNLYLSETSFQNILNIVLSLKQKIDSLICFFRFYTK